MRCTISIVAALTLLVVGCVGPKYVEVAEIGGSKGSNPRGVTGPEETSVPLVQGADRKLYLKVVMNGHELSAAIDTGASPSVVDRAALEKIGVAVRKTGVSGLTLEGRADLFEGTVERVQVGEIEIRGATFTAIDLSASRKQQHDLGLPDIAVLLGSDFLAFFRASVDFDAKTLLLKRPNQSPEPTVMSVTPRADARVAPATTVAHL